MHFPKMLALFSLTVLAAGTNYAQRPDSDLQAKAREALHQADAGTAPAASAPQSVLKPAEMKPAEMKPAPTQVTAQAAPAAAAAAPAAAKTLSPEDEAKVRAQLHSAMQELDAQQKGTVATTAPAKAAPAPVKPVPATPPPAAVVAPAAVVPMTGDKPMVGSTARPDNSKAAPPAAKP